MSSLLYSKRKRAKECLASFYHIVIELYSTAVLIYIFFTLKITVVAGSTSMCCRNRNTVCGYLCLRLTAGSNAALKLLQYRLPIFIDDTNALIIFVLVLRLGSGNLALIRTVRVS